MQLGNPKQGRIRSWERSLTRAFHYKVLIHSLYKESLDCTQWTSIAFTICNASSISELIS